MIFTIYEFIDALVMTLAIGFIFMGVFERAFRREALASYKFNWEAFKFSCIVTAPAIILHELAHKFVALALGFTATFNASYFGLALGIFLKLIKSPLIFFVPAFVEISCGTASCIITPLDSALTALAGPGMNLLVFLVCWLLLKKGKYTGMTAAILLLTKQINLFLFIFNMIPLPGFDGYHVYGNLWRAFSA
jgi:Zn-dependent protease